LNAGSPRRFAFREDNMTTVLPSVHVQRGDAVQAMAQAPHQLQGQLEIGGQEHYYLEGQIAYALPQDNGEWLIHSSTQHPGEAQHWVAHALHIPLHQVRVLCRRMGGGLVARKPNQGIWRSGLPWQPTKLVDR
jgi:xanthine dehydrogenase large subunit